MEINFFFELFATVLTASYSVLPSLGVAIIVLTLLVRILLLPLSIKQTRSMREMSRLQPEVKRIQAKYKGDRQKMNEEMMALYKEHGVNPFGGCLPLLMQFPVLIGLFYVVQAPLKYMGFNPPPGAGGDAPPPLSEYVVNPDAPGIQQAMQSSDLANDLIHHALDVSRFLGLRLDCKPANVLSGEHSGSVPVSCGEGVLSFLPYALLIVLMGVTTWYQSKQMAGTRDPSNPQAQQMQLMGRIMPIMLMVFAFNFPTGVVLYWLTTNLWTIAQQRIIMAAVPQQETPTGSGDGKAGKRAVANPPQQRSKGAEAATDGRARKTSARAGTASKKKKKR